MYTAHITQGMITDVVFELQDLGVHFWGAEVYKIATHGQGASKGVLIGSKVQSMNSTVTSVLIVQSVNTKVLSVAG
jgi:hypothetical protein